MRRFILCIVSVIALATSAFGESILSRNESLVSGNGQYQARIAQSPNGVSRLQVYQVETGRLLWERNIDWTEACLSLLSNDGTVFSIINEEYSDKQFLVITYTKDSQAGYSVKEIRFNYEDLLFSNQKKIWIDLSADVATYLYDDKGNVSYLDLITISGKTLEIPIP